MNCSRNTSNYSSDNDNVYTWHKRVFSSGRFETSTVWAPYGRRIALVASHHLLSHIQSSQHGKQKTLVKGSSVLYICRHPAKTACNYVWVANITRRSCFLVADLGCKVNAISCQLTHTEGSHTLKYIHLIAKNGLVIPRSYINFQNAR